MHFFVPATARRRAGARNIQIISTRTYRVVLHPLVVVLRPAAHVGVLGAGVEIELGRVVVVALAHQVPFHVSPGLVRLTGVSVLVAEQAISAGTDRVAFVQSGSDRV